MNNKIAIGVDIGGTKINIAAVNSEAKILKLQTIKTPSENKKLLLKTLKRNLASFYENYKKISGIGIATAGRIIFKEKKIAYTTDNLKEWDQINLYQELKENFNTNIYIDNDVNAALLSELTQIKNTKEKNIIFITIGTGLGGALAINGKIIRGNSGSTGEFGHMVLYPQGKQCNCGKNGCAEQYISGRAYKMRLKENLNREKTIITKKSLSIKKIEREIKNKNGIYYQTLKEMIKDLAVLLENLKNAIDYDICILGGSFSAYEKIIIELLNNYSKIYQAKYYKKSKFKFSYNKDKAGVIGAGLMVFEKENL